ncbi:ESX secretion-associated protein EspG [Phytohabitans suffuscus]|uniref:ESX secretion-associated protein EspG n=1 Tax=Phytohabitans suffuscus TaxID=624315 RepID=A0A6F8YU20_9ACTN|nr:ESX secretion-associated protein EspG [Phytohabitans suffuscus]BCB89473.1 hypothetical protein Psuf_067860 [Phytohabitans suffuscus]
MTGIDPLTGLPALTLSNAEFAALARALGEPAPDRIAGATTDRPRDVEARLLERGVVVSGTAPRVAVTAARLVRIVCRPFIRTRIRLIAPGRPPVAVHVASVPEASIGCVEDGTTVHYVPFGTEQLIDYLALAAELTEPAGTGPPGAEVPIALPVLRAAVQDGRSGAADRLRAAGLTPTDAAGLGAALSSGSWGSLSVRYRAGAGRVSGGEIAWAGERSGRWQVPAALFPAALLPPAEPAETAAPRDAGGDLTVTVQPVTAAGLLAEAVSVLPGPGPGCDEATGSGG